MPRPVRTHTPWSWFGAIVRRREPRFLVVGGVNTLVGLGSFVLFERLLGDRIGYLGALVLAYAVGIAVGFVLHRRYVFKVEGSIMLDLVRFVGVQLSALVLNSLILPLLVELAHVPVVPAQVLALAMVLVATYFAHLYFSFRRPRIDASATRESGQRLAGGDDDR
jgi:putative flippase GtrA